MRNTPSNTDNIIDSRDVIKRIEELEDERTALVEAVEEAREAFKQAEGGAAAILTGEELQDAETAFEDWTAENESELTALKDLQDECEGISDWPDGETLIADDYFEEYAQDLAEDLGYIKRDVSWPYTCIDWERAADELKQDYTCVSFDGNDYWIRS